MHNFSDFRNLITRPKCAIVGAKFGVCRSLESRDMSLIFRNLWNDKKKERFLVGKSSYNSQNTRFGLVR